MTMPLSEFMPELRRHHGIYVMRKTYEGTCAFLTGYELGSERPALKAFHNWLVPRGKGRPELYWPQLVLCEIYEDGALPDIRYLTPEEDERAIEVLFELLEEYFASCSAA
ncbi:hypothetical protein V2S66_13740 [Streptomyces sp. V4-01]|uniref:Uncharacterized protein n=1 Tax=Actinacidiphila polyblastidii TaxID=3110430 RepID=A0ABU7PB41_9ACTN|nr:hypothetical protein [Streptomyces sp. V4-01]